jgi:hypothetical protein
LYIPPLLQNPKVFVGYDGLVEQITLSTDRALPETDFRRSVRN